MSLLTTVVDTVLSLHPAVKLKRYLSELKPKPLKFLLPPLPTVCLSVCIFLLRCMCPLFLCPSPFTI